MLLRAVLTAPCPGLAFQTGSAGESAGQADFTSKMKKRTLFWGLRLCCCFIYYFLFKSLLW